MLLLSLQGTMKGLLPQQVKDAGASLILGNTYHLGTRPVSHTTFFFLFWEGEGVEWLSRLELHALGVMY